VSIFFRDLTDVDDSCQVASYCSEMSVTSISSYSELYQPEHQRGPTR
jgi:hypothetical protein